MCGIFGIFGEGVDRSHSKELWQVFNHRGPDAHGMWSDTGALLGHCRLAILDLSPHARQPMLSASGRFVLSYNGEIYNYRGIAKELEEAGGVKFCGTGDSEVLLAAIETWGIERTLEQIDGIFAFGLWDKKERRLHLARDRFGVKPLVFGWRGDSLFFSSDTRFIFKLLGETPRLNPAGVNTFLRYGYVVSPFSIFEGVHKLPPASHAIFGDGDFRAFESFDSLQERRAIRRYWRPEQLKVNGSISAADAESESRRLLEGSVRAQMVSDVPLGAFLSGGVDSSTVVALMSRLSAERVKTFSIGFDQARYNEAPHARAVAEHLGTEHHELMCGPAEILEIIPQLSSVYDEPFGDSSQIPTLLVSQFARRHVTVVLSGDGGDELFGGYARYSWTSRLDSLQRAVPQPMRNLLALLIEKIGMRRWQWILSRAPGIIPKQIPLESVGLSALTVAKIFRMESAAAVYDFMCSQWPRIERAGIFLEHPLAERLSRVFGEGEHSLAERMSIWDLETYLPDDILTKVDRASMWWGLEARVPLLDRRLVEFVLSLPREMRFSRRPAKRMLRAVLDAYVPRQLIEREKQGFGAPVEIWVTTVLRDWVESLLPRAEDLFQEFAPGLDIRAEWHGYLAGKRSWSPGLWSALMLAAWAERWLKRSNLLQPQQAHRLSLGL